MKYDLTTSSRKVCVDRSQISFVKFILEAYDNVAVVTTLDAGQGLVVVTVSPGCERLVDGIIESLSEDCHIVSFEKR